ncbi:MAG: hypothetical protein AB7L91_17985 [Dehalococcoidia bacterium]
MGRYSDAPRGERIDGQSDPAAAIAQHWPPDGPHTTEAVRSAAEAFAEIARYLARSTMRPDAFPHAGDVYAVLAELRSGIGRLDQTLAQVSSHTAAFADDPALYDDRGPAHDPARAVREVQGGLDAARVALGPVLAALDSAHSSAGHLGHRA